MPFQSVVNTDPAPAIEGDFASANPRRSLLAGPSQFVAGPGGLTVGRFAWANTVTNYANNFNNGGLLMGFVHRNQPVVITAWLGEAVMTVTQGLEVTLFDGGDYWARFAAGATIGQKVYANTATGVVTAAATGAPTTATVTANFTSGSPTMTVTAGSGLLIGQPVTGTGIPAGTYISAFGTGTGGTGTYTLSANATATNTGVTVTYASTVETQFYVHSLAASGELAKISTARI